MFRTTATACCSTLRRRGPRDRSWLRPRRLISPRQWWMRTTCSPALLHPRSPPEQPEPLVRRPRRLARPSPQAAQRPLPSRLLQLRPPLSSSSSTHLERLKAILSGMVFFVFLVRRDEAADTSIDDSNERIYGGDIAGEVDGAMVLRRLWENFGDT